MHIIAGASISAATGITTFVSPAKTCFIPEDSFDRIPEFPHYVQRRSVARLSNLRFGDDPVCFGREALSLNVNTS